MLLKLHVFMWFIAVLIHTLLLISSKEMFPSQDNFTAISTVCESRQLVNSKRAVLFLLSGINASFFYESIRFAEHSLLRETLIENGSWGISWTKESSSSSSSSLNLLSILSGTLFDDIKWFKTNKNLPDDLTKYMNQVIYVGGPAVKEYNYVNNKWEFYSYPKIWDEYTSTYDSETMDKWVRDQTISILQNKSVNNDIETDKALYIICFEGLQVINRYHSIHSPKIVKKMENILKYIDQIIVEFSDTFSDGQTSFMLASDYIQYNEEYNDDVPIPILAWGAQISPQIVTKNNISIVEKLRRDLVNANIEALISCLLGTESPVNSISLIPFNYLKSNSSFLSRCLMSKIKQLKNLFFQEYDKVNANAYLKLSTPLAPINLNIIEGWYASLESNINNEKYNVVINEGEILMLKLERGTLYYRLYYSRVSKIVVCILYLGWMLQLMLYILMKSDEDRRTGTRNLANIDAAHHTNLVNSQQQQLVISKKLSKLKRWTLPKGKFTIQFAKILKKFTLKNLVKIIMNLVYLLLSVLILVAITLADWPTTLVFSTLTMFCVWWSTFRCLCTSFPSALNIFNYDHCTNFKFFFVLITFIFHVCFFLDNLVLTVSLIFVMLLLPFTDYRLVKNCYVGDWILTSLSFISMNQYYMKDHLNNGWHWTMIQLSAWIIITVSLAIKLKVAPIDYPLLILSMIALIITTASNYLLDSKTIRNTIWLWLLSLVHVAAFFIGSNKLLIRLVQNGMCLCIPFSLSAQNIEALVYLAIMIHLCAWVTVETYDKNEQQLAILSDISVKQRLNRQKLRWSNFRRAYFLIFYFFICYPALGNTKDILQILNGIELNCIFTSWTSLVIFLFKLTNVIITISMFYLFITKFKRTSLKYELICPLILFTFMGFLLLLKAVISNSVTSHQVSVSNYVFAQLVILLFLLTYPVSHCLTTTSLISLTNFYNQQGNHIPPSSPII